MPWTYDDPPAVAQNWTDEEQRRCVDAANAVLEEGGTDEEAIFACISAAGKGERRMETKTYRAPIELKQEDDEEKGEFRATFSRFNVIDHDGDVTVPGAFKEGQEVIVEPWNHGWTLPTGKGVIKSDEEKAWIDGRFFLETQAGREHYSTVKGLGGLAEWSYSFDIEEAGEGDFEGSQVRFLRQLDVVGVGPVTRGAGIGTETTAIKDRKKQGEGEDEAEGSEGPSGKSSESDDLLTRINLVEADVIRQRIQNA